MKYIKVENNVVVNVLEPIDGFDITECFHPQVLASCVQVEEAEIGWVKQEDGTFAAPVVEETPTPTEPTPPTE